MNAYIGRKLVPTKRGFFDLPPTVRRRIYILAPLISSRQIYLNQNGWVPGRKNEALATSLLYVSRTVNAEAIGILYGLNKFQVDVGSRLEANYSLSHQRLVNFTVEALSSITSLSLELGMLFNLICIGSQIAANNVTVTEDREENEHRRHILLNLENIVQSLKKDLGPGQIKLTFGFDALDITMANNVAKLLLQLPIMKDCAIRLSDKPTLNMRQLAERTAIRMKGINHSLSKKTVDPFPFSQLPKELRLMVLKHTDLVRSKEHGFAVQDLQMWILEETLMPLETCCHRCTNKGDICCCQRVHAAYSATCICPWPSTCLLSMSKQMREEVMEVLFTSNCIHLRHPDRALRFLRSLRPSDLRYIQHLEIDFYPRRTIARGYFALRYHQLQWTTLSKFMVENLNLPRLFLRINSEENHIYLFTAQKSLR